MTDAPGPLELAAAYAAARYSVDLDGRRIPFAVGRPAATLEHAWPRPRYGFLTAWNPGSRLRPEETNRAADARLATSLAEAGWAARRAVASDAGGDWEEPGWLVGDVDAAAIAELGRRFDQAGVLAWERGRPVRLLMLLPPPAGIDRPGFTDWVE